MRTLVLFDADQFDWQIPQSNGVPVVRTDAQAAVEVVVGMNLATAADPPPPNAARPQIDTATIGLLAERLAQFAGERLRLERPVPCRLQIALVPVAPEACDVALVRLAVESPDEYGAGDFHRLFLFTGDHGLAQLLCRRLGAIGGGLPRARPEKSPFRLRFREWCACRGRVLVQRRRVSPEPVVAPPLPPATRPLGIVDSPPAAAWAAGRSVEVSGDLADIARAVRAAPALLSQVGPTATSLRGVWRLSAYALRAGEPVPVGRCSAGDGFETYAHRDRAPDAPPRAGDELRCEPSPLGPGVVRVRRGSPPDWVDSFRTRLPYGLLRRAAAAGRLRLGSGLRAAHRPDRRINDQATLAGLPGLVWSEPGDLLRVGLEAGSKGGTVTLSAHLAGPPSGVPEWWWYLPDPNSGSGRLSAGTKLRLEVPEFAGLLPERVERVAAFPAVPPGGGALVFRASPSQERLTVVPEAGSGSGFRIVPATWEGVLRVALLGLATPVERGRPVQCRCVQDLPRRDLERLAGGRWQGGGWIRIKDLPLVVALPTRWSGGEEPG